MARVEKPPNQRATLPAHVGFSPFATRGRPRTEGSPRVPRVLLEQRLAPLSPEKGQGRQHAWSLDATLSLPPPLSPSASPSLPRPSAVASSASPAPERRRLEPLRTRRWRCRSQDMTDPQDSPLKGRLQRALAQRRASEEVQSARKGTVREHKRKATTQIDLIEGRPVTKSEREKWDAAFARYQLDGEIHVDELKGALVMCGFCDARPTVVQKVLEGLTKFNSLNKAEFYLFVCRFEAGLHETYEFEFNLLDTGHRGTIDVLQLEQLLRRIGQPVRRFVLKELVQEVDDDNEGRVDLSGFRKIQHLIRKREGFTCYELDHFYRVFQRFDRDNSDSMSCSEFANALTWLGFPYGPEKLQEFHRQSDVDGDGQLGEGEFIGCLRRVLDEEMKQVESFLSRASRGGQAVSGDRFKAFIHGLGYSSSPQAILDALSNTMVPVDDLGQASLQDMKLQLSLDDVCKVLGALRACDGFTQKELRELKQSFTFCNPEKQDQVQAPAINRALRWLGHRLSLQQTLRLIAEVDADGGSSLDFTMFVKVVRKCNEKDQAKTVEVFQEFDTQREGVLDCDQQNQALTLLNCVDAMGRLPYRSASEMEGADLRVFLGIVERFKKSCLTTFRQNQGFGFHEVEELQQLFRRFDRDQDWRIWKPELVQVIEVLFPLEARCREFRPFLVQILQSDEELSLSFSDFLVIMRKIVDQQEQIEFVRQRLAIERLGFSPSEANQFRELFILADKDNTQRLTLDQIRQMLCKSFPLNDGHMEQLRAIFHHAIFGTGHHSLVPTAGFIEFLQIMSEVVQMDWCSKL